MAGFVHILPKSWVKTTQHVLECTIAITVDYALLHTTNPQPNPNPTLTLLYCKYMLLINITHYDI